MFSIFRIALLPLLLASLASGAPAWRQELTSPAPGPFAKPVPSVVDMRLTWKGMINSGTLRIEFAPPNAKKSGAFIVRSSSASTGAAAALFPYKSNFWSEINPATLRPRFFQSTEVDKKESATTVVRYFADRVESHESAKISKTGVSQETKRVYRFSPVFDIFSSMLHIRSQKLGVGDRVTLVIHPFDNPYLLRVRVIGREIHKGRNAIRLSVGMQKIDRKTQELQPYKKLKQDATLWLSDDADRIPIEFRAAVFIGDVRATLVRHQKY